MKFVILTILALYLLGCDESLPPRIEPKDLFDGKIEAEYILTASENVVRVRIFIKNTFDETLEGKSNLNGFLQIVSARDPKIKFETKISNSNIISAPFYDPQTRQLRINPGETLSLNTTWNFFTTDSTDLRVEFFKMFSDTNCNGRLVAQKENFKINGDLQIFENLTSVVFDELLFSICYTNIWTRQGTCPPIECK